MGKTLNQIPYVLWGVEGELPLLIMYGVEILEDKVIAQGLTVLHKTKHLAELKMVRPGEYLTRSIFVCREEENSPVIVVPEIAAGNYLILKEPAEFVTRR